MTYVAEYPIAGLKTTFTIALSLLRLILSNLTLKPLLGEYHRDQLTDLIAQKNYPFVF